MVKLLNEAAFFLREIYTPTCLRLRFCHLRKMEQGGMVADHLSVDLHGCRPLAMEHLSQGDVFGGELCF